MSQALWASAGRKAIAAAAEVERLLDDKSGFCRVQWRELSDATAGTVSGWQEKVRTAASRSLHLPSHSPDLQATSLLQFSPNLPSQETQFSPVERTCAVLRIRKRVLSTHQRVESAHQPLLPYMMAHGCNSYT